MNREIYLDYIKTVQETHRKYAKEFKYDKRHAILGAKSNHRVMVRMAWRCRQIIRKTRNETE